MLEEKIKQIRMYLMDSLIARSGQVIAADVVTDICNELMERINDVLRQEDAP